MDPNAPLEDDQTIPSFAPPTFGDAFKGSWDAISRTRGIDAEWRNQKDWLQDQLDSYQKKSGERLSNPLEVQGGQDLLDGYKEKFAKAGMQWPSDADITQGGIGKARAAARNDWLNSNGPGFAGWAGRQAAGLASTSVDPINAASVALAPEGGLLLRAAGVGAGFAGATGIENALTFGYQKQVDPSVTAGRAFIREPLEAGVSGFALDAGGAALARWWRGAKGTPEATRAPIAVQDAGRVAEKAADIQAQAPFKGADAAQAHAAAVKETEAAIIDDRPPELPLQAQAQAEARRGTAFYPGGRVDLRYELAEASDLITSHDATGRVNQDYPSELQPRDRSGAASLEQVNEMASRFEPERMAPNSDANMGPPIIGPDNVVESGNGRTAAIRTMYDRVPDRAAAYRGWLEDQGHDTTGMKEPVLVGRRLEDTTQAPFDRAAFAQSLTGSGLRLGATEQALSDARFLSPRAMEVAKEGAVDSVANRDFVRSVLAAMPQAEHGQMLTKAGGLSAPGKRRLEAALTARAYGDQGVVHRLYEHPDPNIRTLGYGLREAAVPWARMRDAAATGDIAAGHDVTDALMSAVNDVMKARDQGRPLWEVMNQGDMFRSDLSQLVARMLFKDEGMTRLLSQKDIAANLHDYADGALKNSAGPRLFGDDLMPQEILRSTVEKRGAAEPHTADLIDMATRSEAREMPMPDEAEAVRAELDRMRDGGKNLVFATNAKGEVEASVIDRSMAELDAYEAMAKEVRGCSMPAAEAAE